MDAISWKRSWTRCEKKPRDVTRSRASKLPIPWAAARDLGSVLWYFTIYKRNIQIAFWVPSVFFLRRKFLRLLLNLIMPLWLFTSWLRPLMKCSRLIMKHCTIFVLGRLNLAPQRTRIWIISYRRPWVGLPPVFVFLDRWVQGVKRSSNRESQVPLSVKSSPGLNC